MASYAPYSWYFGPDSSKAYIECEASIFYYTINLTKIYVARSGKTTSGIATITADVIPPDPGGSKAYYGEVVFSTTSNQAAGQFNSGNAGVEAEVKLDGEVKASKTSTTYSNFTGAITVTYPDCADAPQCDGEPVPPVINIVPNYTIDGKSCERTDVLEYFRPNLSSNKKFYGDYNFSVCFNPSTEKWQINLEDNIIDGNVEISLCISNLENDHIVINNTDDLLHKSDYEICNIFNDLIKHSFYGSVKTGDYAFQTVFEKHAESHKKKFKEWNDLLWDGSKIIEFNKICTDFKSFSDAYAEAEVLLFDRLNTYRLKMKGYQELQIGDENSDKRMIFESLINIDDLVSDEIDFYWKFIVEKYPHIDFGNCKGGN